MSIAAIVAGCYIAVPVDSHVRKFYGIYAKSKRDVDLDHCADVFKVRTNSKIGRYTNDFIAEFGQIFDRGTDDSIMFVVTVLNELMERNEEYKGIIAKWLSFYETNSAGRIEMREQRAFTTEFVVVSQQWRVSWSRSEAFLTSNIISSLDKQWH